jgi:20S proteasome subunit beta 6
MAERIAAELNAQLEAKSVPIEHRFNPYDQNGGTTLGIAGADFALIAGDTRHTTGYSINSRYMPQIFEVGDGIIISANGFSADGRNLVDRLKVSIEWYHHNHNKKLQIRSAARLIQQILYRKRFFPYYVSTIIAGLDDEGKGAVYSYDPVGSYERHQCTAAGSASSLMMPFLDNQVDVKNQFDPETGNPKEVTPLALDDAIALVKDAFSSATERHIHVGDCLEILVVTKDGVKRHTYPLKRD